MEDENKLIKEWLPLVTFGALVIIIGLNISIVTISLNLISAPSTVKLVIGILILLQVVVLDYIAVKKYVNFLNKLNKTNK